MDPCIISDPATHDNIWIPATAHAGMAIITRDKHIAMRTAEINEVIRSSARMFAITSTDQLQTWDLLTIVVERWEQFELAAREDARTSTRLRALPWPRLTSKPPRGAR